MDNNEFFMRNVNLMALVESEDHPHSRKDQLDDILKSYDNVSKEQVMRHIHEFASKEEMEHYIHAIAVHEHDRSDWT